MSTLHVHELLKVHNSIVGQLTQICLTGGIPSHQPSLPSL